MFYIHMYYMFHAYHPQHILNSPALRHAATIKHHFEEYNWQSEKWSDLLAKRSIHHVSAPKRSVQVEFCESSIDNNG